MKTSFDRICEILKSLHGVPKDGIHPTSHLQEDLNLDSLERVELVMFLEEEFEIEIEDDEAGGWRLVSVVEELVKRKTGT